MPTEMELTLEQTQQGVSHEVSGAVKTLSCVLTLKTVMDASDAMTQNNPSQLLKSQKDLVSTTSGDTLIRFDFLTPIYCDASNQGLGCVLMQRGKVENATAEMLRGLDQLMERKEGGGADKTYYDLRDMYGGHVWRRILLPISWWKIYFEALVDIAEGIENTAKTCVRLIILKRIDKAEVGESGLIRLSWYKRQPKGSLDQGEAQSG
ncbi:hypothetical protein Tco_1086442 [Tanacetum coccineum]